MTDAEREARQAMDAGVPQDPWAHAILFRRLLDEARAEIARLTAPPGASAMERAEKLLIKLVPLVLVNGHELSPHTEIEIGPLSKALVARAIEQAEREATERERERCLLIAGGSAHTAEYVIEGIKHGDTLP